MAQDDGTTRTDVVEWRLTGVRRGLPVLVLACFAVLAVARLVDVTTDDGATIGVYVQLVVSLVGVLAGAVMVFVAFRSRVRLLATGIEVRGGRCRFVAYERITRVYRDRLTSGGATLLLSDGTKVVLTAPVAGLGVASPEVDDAVQQVRTRLPA